MECWSNGKCQVCPTYDRWIRAWWCCRSRELFIGGKWYPGVTTRAKATVVHPVSMCCLLGSRGFGVESYNVRSFRAHYTRFFHVVPVPLRHLIQTHSVITWDSLYLRLCVHSRCAARLFPRWRDEVKKRCAGPTKHFHCG